MSEQTYESLTTKQAANYLNVSRATVYYLIREGRLVTMRQGWEYRIPKWSLELLLLGERTGVPILVREYSCTEIEGFLYADILDAEAEAVVTRFGSRHS